MEKTLKLVGKNSNEIFGLRYPSTLLVFCEYDFSYYAQEAIEVCNEALKTGTPDFDRISEIKKDIQSAHCYLQYSTRTAYDKVVYDCWIDYVCRRDNIGDTALWNRFIRCKTQFEKIIFQRLCDFRYNRAVNEWLNIIRVQDYAKNKVAFVFSEDMKSPREAEERRNYFDLMFSVTARELGCRLEDLGVTKYYTIGRTPGSPFLFPNASKEIIRHVLAGFDYSDDYSDIEDYTESADEIAMDAFSRMKAGLPPDLSTYKIPPANMENFSDRIYMPCGLKAAIDLEIDAIIESGMWLAKCKRCGLYFAKSKDYTEDYCQRRTATNTKTCLEMYEEENPRPKMTDALLELCNTVTDEMYSRVDKTMSVHEYDSWRSYLEAMKQKVDNGEISPSELESFLEYSREVDISKSKPILEVPKKEPEVSAPKERVVKPFIPERISRSDIKPYDAPEEKEEPAEPAEKPSREGFFTSPSVQRQKGERPQISHIIRNGEPLGGESVSPPDPAGFQPFGVPQRSAQPRTSQLQRENQPITPQPGTRQSAKREERDPYENLKRLEARLEAERRLREERNTFKPLVEQAPTGFVEDFPQPPRPERRGPYPERRGPYPERRDSYPERQEPYPERRESYPERQESYPERQEPYPKRQESYPERQESYPERREPYPERREPYPERQESYPERQEPYPERRESINGVTDAPARAYNEEQKPVARVMRSGEYPEESLRTPSFEAQPEQFDRRTQPEQPDRRTQPEQPDRRTQPEQPDRRTQPEQPAQPPKPRVIRKNAAAISAYGRMSGQPVSTIDPADLKQPAAEESAYQNRPGGEYEQPAQPEPAPQIDSEMLEPFKDIGSIFDVLEQSEADNSRPRRYPEHDYSGEPPRREEPRYGDDTPQYDRTEKTERTERFTPDYPERTSPSSQRPRGNDDAPSGFWTEDRGLFRNGGMPETEPPTPPVTAPSDEYSESYSEAEVHEPPQPEAPKGGRHPKSSKTQRLYDVIMREPDDNPNFRRKK